MLAMPGLRAFSLAASQHSCGVSCEANGVFVGEVPLLTRSREVGGWSVRPIATLNAELTVCYRLPVDITAKVGALALITSALNRGDYALAAIAAVQMQFPDPPPLVKDVELIDEVMRRAAELYRSGLLKADWEPTKHPRTGTPPNRGWFAPVPKESKPPAPGWPLRRVNVAAREAFAKATEIFARTGKYLFLGLPVVDGILAFMSIYSPTELNHGEDRLTAQLNAALQPPETLEELQQEPIENILGYEQHHIVEQNPDNLAKKIIEKFGQDMLDDPSNLVWIPRLKHELINAYYSSKTEETGDLTVREYLNELDFDEQWEEGLRIMRKFGVLK